MATGDQNDVAGRLRALLPSGWFPDNSPVLTALLNGFANGLSQSYSLIEYALAQVLIKTSSSIWLDLHAQDFFGSSLLRRLLESDASFYNRVNAGLFPPANTRLALSTALLQLTGNAPAIFEPEQPQDTGAYGYGGLGYGVAGGYGSLALPFQAFVTVYRPLGQGTPLLAGYSGNTSSPAYAPLGYGTGLGSYIDIAQAFNGVTDANIYAAVANIEPAGSIIWTKIVAPLTLGVFFNDSGILTISAGSSYPTVFEDLLPGSIWNNGGVVSIVLGGSTSVGAPLYYGTVTPAQLLAAGGNSLPITNPGVGTGQLWNNNGVVAVA